MQGTTPFLLRPSRFRVKDLIEANSIVKEAMSTHESGIRRVAPRRALFHPGMVESLKDQIFTL